MELFIGKQLQVVGYSFILGLIFGGLYDIIRIAHCLCGIASYTGDSPGMRRGKFPFLLFFLFDTVYMIAVTAMFSVFLYWQMSGTFRLFVLVSAVLGLAVYLGTAGRIVMLFSETIVRFLRIAVRWSLVKPMRWILWFLCRISAGLYRRTLGRMAGAVRNGMRHIRAERIRRSLKKDIGIFGSKERT